MSESNDNNYTVAVITISDRCFLQEAKDRSGPALLREIELGKLKNAVVVATKLLPDDKDLIKTALLHYCDREEINLILTTGGTGLSPRDVTPDVTGPLLTRVLPGLSHMIFAEGLKHTPFAALSTACVGVRNNSLIVNLPGSESGAVESLNAIASVLPHAMDLILDKKKKVQRSHNKMQQKSKVVVDDETEKNRVRQSAYPMKTMEEMYSILKNYTIPLPPLNIKVTKALGYILAENVASLENMPPYPTSMMDGYAAVAGHSRRLNIIGECVPGKKCEFNLTQANCVRISTGSCLPPGTTDVIPVEHTSYVDEAYVVVETYPAHALNIRKVGSDMPKHAIVLQEGAIVNPSEMSLLASCGRLSISVYGKPVVAILSTGDELVEPWVAKDEYMVYDTNRILLEGLLSSFNYRTVDLGIAKDEPDTVLAALLKSFETADVLVSTGGMSMGHRDIIKRVLTTDLNAEILFGRLEMKPGKPTGFGKLNINGKMKYWIGLPGNPASSFVTFHLVVLPILRILSHYPGDVRLRQFKAQLTHDVKPNNERVEYLRGVYSTIDNSGQVVETPQVAVYKKNFQQSSSILGCTQINCLIEIPSVSDVIPTGSAVTILILPN